MTTYISSCFSLSIGLLMLLPFSLQSAEVTVLDTRELEDMPGKTGQVLMVEYAPGESSAPHRHNAHTFVYVLEGSVVMQVKGAQAMTLSAGQTFYENPDDIHSVSRNASDSEAAKILVFFIKESTAPPTVPVE